MCLKQISYHLRLKSGYEFANIFSLIKPCAKFKSSQLSSSLCPSLMHAALLGYRHEALTECALVFQNWQAVI